ncbi:EAL domain-containing response regulator [Kangiella marina]|uniref:GGDEF domain-containing response regulator n=1 Tax=Kangiella marina TaxID=1079178 RepID=A0ABP8IAI7_9GAMM
MKILIIDDDAIDRESMIRAIKGANFETDISEVQGASEASMLIKLISFDVILLDYNLSSSTGLELLQLLKSESLKESTAVIMVSASTDNDIALECIKAGAQDFLIKTEINAFRLQRAILNAQARTKLEENLRHSFQKAKELAEHDNLTGLTNRYYFDEVLRNEIKQHETMNKKLGLLLIDLDHFKFVNDNHGHDTGDQLLIEVVKRLARTLRNNELFSRLGGDELAITLKGIESPEAAKRVAERLLGSMQEPFEVGNLNLDISASIGIALYPDDAKNEKELLKFADIALFRSKELGRNQYSCFKRQMQEEFLSEFTIENQLKEALKDNSFYMDYQPIISSVDGAVIGAEALIRLKIDGQPLGPNVFIPIAEKSRLIVQIGNWAVRSAIQQLSIWNQDREKPLLMGINISPIQLSNQLVQLIKDCLIEFKVEPGLLELELTETALLTQRKATSEVIHSLSELGCRISLDDFGTGFSSISHLHSFPIDTVKIDRSLMPSSTSTNEISKLLNGLITLLKTIETKVVAEGVESKLDFDTCVNMEVDMIQGYFIGKPMHPNDFQTKFLHNDYMIEASDSQLQN